MGKHEKGQAKVKLVNLSQKVDCETVKIVDKGEEN